MKHFIYRIHNLINGKEYTGKHSTDDLNDGYYGSGTILKRAIDKYGLENFAIEILCFYNSSEEAYLAEEKIVDEEYVWRDDTYNQKLGGTGSWFHTSGMVTVVDKNGNTFNVPIDDPRYICGELKHQNVNMATVTDGFKCFNVPVSDSRYISGELQHISKGTVTVRDKTGKVLKISKDDPRYLSGELTHICKGTISVRDKEDNMFRVSKNDPRYLSGELVGVTKGRHSPNNYSSKTCPHCGKIGKGPNMSRYHFNNCRAKI
jgi:hypothetical protein